MMCPKSIVNAEPNRVETSNGQAMIFRRQFHGFHRANMILFSFCIAPIRGWRKLLTGPKSNFFEKATYLTESAFDFDFDLILILILLLILILILILLLIYIRLNGH